MIPYNSHQQFTVERGFINRTKIYLYPAVVLLQSYRPYMISLRENLLCVSYNYDKIILYYDRSNMPLMRKFIEALKSNNEHIQDYMYSPSVYAIELSPPLNYSAFEEGRYSEIYSIEQIKRVFTNDSKTRMILAKLEPYKQEFVDNLNKWFNCNHTIDSLELVNGIRKPITQFDIPPCLNQEILNYDPKREVRFGRIVKAVGSKK